MNKRMYAIVNKDMGKKLHKRGMTKCYQHVQATHAVAEYILYHYQLTKDWGNETLIVLGASQNQFKHYLNKTRNLQRSLFLEPDLNNETTAFALILKEPDFKIFKRLELL